MDSFFERISSYNIINYIFPGSIFLVFSEYLLGYTITHQNILLELFIMYFIGLVISRIGSIIIEPILKKIKFVEFAPYSDYVRQEKEDQKIKILNDHNNMFRTLCTTMVLLLVLKAYQYLTIKYCFAKYNILILIVGLLILFLFSYRKQANYIKERVKTIN
jgi:hypothetical protein